MGEGKTEFVDPEKEEQIINTAKVYDLIAFYKVPLFFAILALFLLGGAFLLWQINNKSASITFTQEATGSAQIKADIEGAIVKPGVYELISGSRIQDLLILAGGLAAEADRNWVSKNLNLAAKLVDGAKVYIPRIDEVRTGNWEAGKGTININTATTGELDQLPGIGPVTAQKIIDNRPYQTVEDLVAKKILGKNTFEKIKDKITAY